LLLTPTPVGRVCLPLRHRPGELRRADPTHAPQGEKETAGTRVLAFSPAVAVLCDRRGGRGARCVLRCA